MIAHFSKSGSSPRLSGLVPSTRDQGVVGFLGEHEVAGTYRRLVGIIDEEDGGHGGALPKVGGGDSLRVERDKGNRECRNEGHRGGS